MIRQNGHIAWKQRWALGALLGLIVLALPAPVRAQDEATEYGIAVKRPGGLSVA